MMTTVLTAYGAGNITVWLAWEGDLNFSQRMHLTFQGEGESTCPSSSHKKDGTLDDNPTLSLVLNRFSGAFLCTYGFPLFFGERGVGNLNRSILFRPFTASND